MSAHTLRSRFQVTGITIHAAGEQPAVVDAHLTTRRRHTSTVICVRGRGPAGVLPRPAQRAGFATTWAAATGYAPAGLPKQLPGLVEARHEAGDRCCGWPGTQHGPTPTGSAPRPAPREPLWYV